MSPDLYASERAADAAFFEDWSAFRSLDGLPQKTGPVIPARRGEFSRYYCILRRREPLIGGPAFEICVPTNKTIADLIKAIPGARQHPKRTKAPYTAYCRVWFVPSQNWEHVKRALPAIQQMVKSRSQSR